MVTTEKTTKVETDAEQVADTPPEQVVTEPVVEAQPQQVTEHTGVKQGMSRQSIIAISITSAVILFFLGLGLGFVMGNRMASRFDGTGTRTYNQNQLPSGMMRRGYLQNNTGSTTDNNAQTQTN